MVTIPRYVKEVSRETPVPERRSARTDRLSPVAALVRRHDRDRYQTVLFAPAARREALFALYAFNYEIARVRESVTEPMLGQIRLQWWRENIAAAFEGGPVRHHPVVEALTGSIRELPMTRDHFDRLINARETDLDDRPPASLQTLEDYAEATSARLIYLALEVLGVHNSAAGEAAQDVGIAYALAGLLRAMAFHARAGRRLLPTDIVERAGLSEQDYRALRSTPRAVARSNRSTIPCAAETGGIRRLRSASGRPGSAAELAPRRSGPFEPLLNKLLPTPALPRM